MSEAANTAPGRENALRVADEIVSGWLGEVKNSRGYVHDKWQPTSVEARTDAVLRVAEFLSKTTLRVVAPVQYPPTHLHRASCDGPSGELLCGHPADGPTIAS